MTAARIPGIVLVLLVAAATGAGAQAPPTTEGTIIIDEPSDWLPDNARGLTVVAQRSVRVVGRARHPAGVSSVAIDGKQAALRPLEDGSTQFTGYFLPGPKTTSVTVEALTASGVTFSSTYKVAPAVAAPTPVGEPANPEDAFDAAATDFEGQRWAVVVGVSKYRDPRITPLKYADADAKAFYDFLRSEHAGMGGFKPENIRILLNEAATFVEIRKALFDFLKGATEKDVVYIYFAGHGSPDPDRPENLYLIPYDADADNLGGSGLPMEDVNTAIRRLYARHVVVITDACHSAGVSGGGGQRNLAMNQINQAFMEQMAFSRSVMATFTASQASQYSQEGPQWGGGHGVFTYYLLEALKGQADGALDGQPDHIVTLDEMMEWTRERVRRETRNAQTPSIGPTAFDGNWPMAVVLPGTEIPSISLEEIADIQNTTTMLMAAYDKPWRVPDSLMTFVGAADTVQIRLDAENGGERPVLPSHLLKWSTTNPSVAVVDSAGVVRPVGPGATAVRASGFNRTVSVPIRVYEKPTQVVFTPNAREIELTSGERLSIHADLLLGVDRWIRGMTPSFTPPDSVVLQPTGGGEFVALREGETTFAARIAGELREWTVRVRPPLIRIRRPHLTLAVGDSLRLDAVRTRQDGTVLGDAGGVNWMSMDSMIIAVRGSMAHARGVGRVQLIAAMGTSQDTITLFALGDLLLTLEGPQGPELHTLSLRDETLTRLGASTLHGWEPTLSPDGSTIAFVAKPEGGMFPRIHLMDADGQRVRRLTEEMRGPLGLGTSLYQEHSPAWAYDASRIVFASNRPGNYEVMSVRRDGSDVQRHTFDAALDRRVAAAQDGPRIAFERLVGSGNADILIALSDGSEPVTMTNENAVGRAVRYDERRPRFLPGGNQLLYVRGGANLDDRAGEALAIYDLGANRNQRDLVQPVKDNQLIYAVSPDGSRIAYHQRARWGRKNGIIVVIGPDGSVQKTINLGRNREIRDMSWGGYQILAQTQEAQ